MLSNESMRRKVDIFGWNPSIEDGDNTEEGEEAEILFIHSSILTASKQNLVKSKFPWIDMFNHKGPALINVMCDITVRVFEHL